MNGKIGEEEVSEVVEEFEDNKATWKIDSKGRPISVEATLKSTYHGKRSSKEKNLFPQNSNFNRGSYKSMENEWADWTEAGYEVKLKVSLEPPESVRPTDVISEYEVLDPISGKRIYKKEHTFSNQRDQNFARVPKESINKLRG